MRHSKVTKLPFVCVSISPEKIINKRSKILLQISSDSIVIFCEFFHFDFPFKKFTSNYSIAFFDINNMLASLKMDMFGKYHPTECQSYLSWTMLESDATSFHQQNPTPISTIYLLFLVYFFFTFFYIYGVRNIMS